MDKLFGTDGIRGTAGQFPLDYPSLYTLGKSLVSLLEEAGLEPRIIIGRDTRESGEWIEEALFQGIREKKGEAISAGVIPTSAVSFLTKKHRFSVGIVISASHNPYQDNGIKIFSSQGLKISGEWEARLEDEILSSGKDAGRKEVSITPQAAYLEDYTDFLECQLSSTKGPRNLKIVLDCSNGAGSIVAPRVFRELGFKTAAVGNSPNGRNINDCCGSLHPERLAAKVVETGADIGIAYDGDADRAIWVDEKGRILNGDHTLYVQSRFMKDAGRLNSDSVVATTMSNIGLEKALEKMGLKLFRTKVGDKYVLEEMMRLGANLGGEQSGHTIFLDECPTGDGILTSLKMIEVMETFGSPLSKLVEDYEEFPQVLVNVRVSKKPDFREFPEILVALEDIRSRLKDTGRLDVRYSGTEPLARIMLEGENRREIERLAKKMADVISRHLG